MSKTYIMNCKMGNKLVINKVINWEYIKIKSQT